MSSPLHRGEREDGCDILRNEGRVRVGADGRRGGVVVEKLTPAADLEGETGFFPPAGGAGWGRSGPTPGARAGGPPPAGVGSVRPTPAEVGASMFRWLSRWAGVPLVRRYGLDPAKLSADRSGYSLDA